MNKPSHPVTAVPFSPDYDLDGYGWAVAQAGYIRERRFELVEWDRIAEEIEDLGQSEYRALESALRVLLIHMLKWDLQPAFRSRSWVSTIREQHRQFERSLKKNPSLQSSLEEIREEAYRQALVAAMVETGIETDHLADAVPGWNIIRNPPMREEDIATR